MSMLNGICTSMLAYCVFLVFISETVSRPVIVMSVKQAGDRSMNLKASILEIWRVSEDMSKVLLDMLEMLSRSHWHALWNACNRICRQFGVVLGWPEGATQLNSTYFLSSSCTTG